MGIGDWGLGIGGFGVLGWGGGRNTTTNKPKNQKHKKNIKINNFIKYKLNLKYFK